MLRAYRIGCAIAIVLGFLIAKALHAGVLPNVTITGATKDCFMRSMITVGGVNVSAFQVNAARPIIAQLDTMANFTGFATHDTLAFNKYDAMESRLQSLILKTHALSRKMSAPDGSFTMTFEPVDSVLVIGFADREDEMYYFGYKYLSGRASTSFVLDMSGGACEPQATRPQE
jgi:glucan phosphoethanolaminetransferase (alkaline phosphatase superfamily)